MKKKNNETIGTGAIAGGILGGMAGGIPGAIIGGLLGLILEQESKNNFKRK